MKKRIAAGFLYGVMGLSAMGASGYFEAGTEIEDFTSSYEEKDFVLPYIKGKLSPYNNSPFFIEAKYSYRLHEDDKEHEGDRRKRTELYLGYAWEMGRFKFTPKAGIRYENYASSETGDSAREATYDEIIQYRIYPNMSYTINDSVEWFFEGFLAPTTSKLNDTKTRGGDGVEGKEYGSDYRHELDSGLKFKLPNGQKLSLSLYSEYKREVYASSTEEYQFRIVYDHKLKNGKTTLTPFARIGLEREQRYKDGSDLEKDRLRHRFGLKTSHKVSEDFTLLGEVYYQTGRVEDSSGNRESDENKMFYKVGFRQAF
ncbi:hypothetical protein PM10SUCC1_08540 [Propionigenium maris DSM 9537]|uniref:Porin n=1 Tax=Propionigenium maris DSM 9537 TaxID=1123000 RepID=A0A9W6LMX6_9FUSO|nr:OmpG family monomeric porin [Propionigenium maris]GLI55340.1 hypothetical protein PM10SUCC1_08540 [Propionigenium maris DSM 9537]